MGQEQTNLRSVTVHAEVRAENQTAQSVCAENKINLRSVPVHTEVKAGNQTAMSGATYAEERRGIKNNEFV